MRISDWKIDRRIILFTRVPEAIVRLCAMPLSRRRSSLFEASQKLRLSPEIFLEEVARSQHIRTGTAYTSRKSIPEQDCIMVNDASSTSAESKLALRLCTG